jgi:ketosteroid isomerase-like protein
MSEENVEVVRRLYDEHWACGDFAFAGFFDPEVEFARLGAEGGGVAGRWRGLEEVWAGTLEYLSAFADLRTEAERIIDLGDDRVLVLSRQSGRGKLSGAPIEHELGDLFTLHDGKVVRGEFYWDRSEALEAAGLEE